MPRFLASLAAASLVCAFAHAADASPEPRIAFRLEYEAPSAENECPSLEALSLAISHEFGYVVIKPNAPAVLRLELHQVGKRYEAEISGPDPAGGSSQWHHKENRVTCRELVYDVASIVRINYGPSAWGSDTPPEILAARPEFEVSSPAIHHFDMRLLEPFALPSPQPAPAFESTPASPDPPVQAEVTIGAAVTPYGLPSAAIGGNGMLFLRWSRFALGADVRGVITPALGIGDPPAPGRTSLVTIALLGCATPRFFEVCGIVNGSRMNFDLDTPSQLRFADGASMGFGARFGGRWNFASRFTLIGYGEITAEIRNLVFRAAPEATPTVLTYYWRSPAARATFGLAIAASLFD